MVYVNETIVIRSSSVKLAIWVKRLMPLLRILHTLSFHSLCLARPEQRSPAEGKVKDRSYQVCPTRPFRAPC